MTDFRRLSAAKHKLEEFEISKDASRLGLRDVPVKRRGKPNL
jgi:hypothetical protein